MNIVQTEDLNNLSDWYKQNSSIDTNFVYMFCDVDEDNNKIPIYVGKTQHLQTRFLQHAEKSWFRFARLLAIEPFPNETLALKRESYLINTLNPLFNKNNGSHTLIFSQPDLNSMDVIVNDIDKMDIASVDNHIGRYLERGAFIHTKENISSDRAYTLEKCQNHIYKTATKGQYNYRRGIPKKYRNYFLKTDGSTRGREWKESLKTNDEEKAKLRAHIINNKFDKILEAAKRGNFIKCGKFLKEYGGYL
tara:strand:+ start:100 stop:846 length:747 start_codon:yes stop_codon:yes gene_type:complete